MSEFKFACPICGQHITADSDNTGSQIPCPTCYRKIVVPQAPTTPDTKFVVSASEANKPKPPPPTVPQLEAIRKIPEKITIPSILIILLALACVAGATLFVLRGKIFHSSKPPETTATATPNTNKTGVPAPPSGPAAPTTTSAPAPAAPPEQPLFTGQSLWTLELTNVAFPGSLVSGSIHNRAFTVEHATLAGSNLVLRAGSRNGPVELGVNIVFFNHEAEELSGITAVVKPTDDTAPRVVLHWKEEDRKSEVFHHGYAMRVEFDAVANNYISGRLFLCLPDESKSWVAGTFRARISKPGQRKPQGQGQ